MTTAAADVSLSPPASETRSRLKSVLHVLGTIVTVAAVVGWVFLLRPQSLGGPASYVMVSGESMEPTYESGDFVVALERDSYGIGDVLVYRVPEGNIGAGRLIIHRAIDGNEVSGFRTQGDNRPTPDEWRPTEKDIVGKLWFHIPSAGGVLPYLRSPIVLASFFGIFTFLLVFLERDKKPEEDEGPQSADGHEGAAVPVPVGQAAIAQEATPKRSLVRPAVFLGLGLTALVAGALFASRRSD